ncbi:MAG TPA: hypothetical protein VKT32_17560, partial [Chthonomonadaceae bacterium]|nr:hypothetical protein [Chthonomonadaceae bacterium]
LWLHLFICCVWLYLFNAQSEPPGWMFHVFIWSILAIQFSWGFTIGLIVGPSRKRRPLLWASLFLIFMPLWFVGHLVRLVAILLGPLWALFYLTIFTIILASETYCGVLLGAKIHSESEDY